MQEMLVYLRNDRVFKFAFTSSVVLLLCQAFFLIVLYANLPPLIPLYLQRPWGFLQIATKIQILIVPVITLCLITVNTFLSTHFYKESPLIARILVWVQALFSLLATLAVVRITLLVI